MLPPIGRDADAPQQEIAEAYGIIKQDGELDNQTALRLKKGLAEQFRLQLTPRGKASRKFSFSPKGTEVIEPVS
jgi:hypothetical protein